MSSQNKKLKIILTAIIVVSFFALYVPHKNTVVKSVDNLPLWKQTINFSKTKYSNETGNPTGEYLVPNYIHFIKFNAQKITYVHMICILAAFKNQKPEKIFFHRNFNTSFEGKYWDVLKNTKGFLDIVVFNYIPIPEEFFGQRLDPNSAFTVYHASDFARVLMLKKYGGIILDSDTYIINNLNQFRTFEMTLNWDENQFLGTQLFIAHKDARFLQLYLETYRHYRPDLWYYNAGELPTTSILYKNPELIHRVKVLFGADTKFIGDIFQTKWSDWRNFFAVHLLVNHQYLLQNVTEKATFPVNFNEQNIVNYPVTFREMAYDVYDIAGVDWPKETKD
uniref:Alpha-1,4-N-acetylglucosaminyltransferase n=1 Tax=Clastoptera arizonana TaxID=38151 RepID=A0A1B6EFU2_9HEMI